MMKMEYPFYLYFLLWIEILNSIILFLFFKTASTKFLLSTIVLLLLLCDNDKENFDKVYALNKSIQLPVSIEEVEITREDLPAVIKKTISMKDIDHNPYRITEEMLLNAFETLEKINQN